MCGILFGRNTDEQRFKKALDEMNHRGPDDTGIKVFENVSMGHKRLSIVDLDKRSSQPFSSSNGKYEIIFNGEIYNFKDLKEKFNIKTKTTSDTEVLIELYIQLGKKMLDHLNGMFAFVIYNIENKEIFIARDRLGIKPLYTYEKEDILIYSSEIAPILEILDETPEYDLIGIRQYLKLRTFFRGHTLYKDIKMFPAGYFMENGIKEQYWNIEDYKSTTCDDKIVRKLIDSAIEYRKIADVETGSYLSGGVDSSIIAAVANKEHTWTIGFKDLNEFKYARLVADKYKFKHHEILISRDEYKEIAKLMIEKRKEPLSVPNEVSIFKMTESVAKYNTVVLSGEGADELFFGYDRIFRWANENEFNLAEFDKMYSYGSHKDDEILEYILEPVSHIKDNLLKISTFFQLYHLHGLLRRLDNSSMICSVEARVPFVDHRIIEYMYGVNFKYKMKHGIVKDPLKRLYKKELPIEVIERKKVGFPVPVEDIFKNENSGIDGWLHFNMEILLKEKWKEIKEQLNRSGINI